MSEDELLARLRTQRGLRCLLLSCDGEARSMDLEGTDEDGKDRRGVDSSWQELDWESL